MNLLVVALPPEAQPIKEKLRLKRDLSVTSHEVYCNDQWTLIISGAGPIQSAIATTLALRHLSSPPLTITNLGVAGGSSHYSVGTLCRIVKIQDGTSGETYFPDLILDDRLESAFLKTFARPFFQGKTEGSEEFLADMEGSGFFSAAHRFVPLERILMYKIVSDNFSSSGITKELIAHSVEKNLDRILQCIESLAAIVSSSEEDILSAPQRERLRSIEHTLSLTASQRRLLEKAAITCEIQTTQLSERLESLSFFSPQSKSERKVLFDGIIDELS